MTIGYRVFIVEGDAVTHIAQRTFDSFYLRRVPSLMQYANQTIMIATAMYELADRLPSRVIRIDTLRLKVNAMGSLDEDDHHEYMRLAMNRIGRGARPQVMRTSNDGAVTHAEELFDERRWKQNHPELSGPALRNILKSLFGPAI